MTAIGVQPSVQDNMFEIVNVVHLLLFKLWTANMRAHSPKIKCAEALNPVALRVANSDLGA